MYIERVEKSKDDIRITNMIMANNLKIQYDLHTPDTKLMPLMSFVQVGTYLAMK